MGHLFAIDIGNTNIVLGLYEGEALAASWRLATDSERMPDEYAVLLLNLFANGGADPGTVTGCIISCVVPPLLGTFLEVVRTHFSLEPLVVGPGVKTGVRIRTDNPREVGADRIANAAAAARIHGLPAILIDFGTATTFDALSQEGDYLGGAIAPGMGLAAEALAAGAAQLHRFEVRFPPSVIGKNTVHAMQSGLVWGYVALVEGMVKRMGEELGDSPVVVATGGLAPLVAGSIPAINKVDPNLTLEGLRIIYELNLAD